MASEKVNLAILPPSTIYGKDPRAELTENEQRLYDQVLAHFTNESSYALPGVENGALTEDEKFWLSRECLLRFLRASKWKQAVAIQRLETTLKWRREYGLYDIVKAAHVEPEAVTGKEILFGYDVKGKPAFYMIPSRQNTNEPTRQIQFAVWMLERCVDLMEPGVETIALLINFADKAKNPSISTARAVLNILQDHYPERLGLALIINVPMLVHAFFKIVMPFVDPVTRGKVKFNPKVIDDGLFTPDMLMQKWWNGSRDFEYVHEKYWAHLNELCDSRAKAWRETWRELGAKIGISEWSYKKGPVLAAKVEAEVEKDVSLSVAPVESSSTTTTPPAMEAENASETSKPAVEPEVKHEPAVEVPKDVEPEVKEEKLVETPKVVEPEVKQEKKEEDVVELVKPTEVKKSSTVEEGQASQSGPSTVAVAGAGAVAGSAGGGGGAGDSAGDSGGGDGGE